MTITLKKPAVKFLRRLPEADKRRIMKAIDQLPDAGDIQPLETRPGVFRLRVGDFRVLFTVTDERVTVLTIGNRGEIYKGL